MDGMDSIGDRLVAMGLKGIPESNGPLWKGPEKDGITFSLLSRFLVCRERFRLLVCEGLKADEGWNHRLGYGNMWHVCEEAMAKQEGEENWCDWEAALQGYCSDLCNQHPLQQELIGHWYRVCCVQFPLYIDHWQRHPDMQAENRRPRFSEKEFAILYPLPSGRKVTLRGKWDSVDLVKQDKVWGVWLQENKTKGNVNILQLQRQLTFDLQTMLYLTALEQYFSQEPIRLVGSRGIVPIKGVRYNVVRRPLSGGKGTIVRHKATNGTKCTKCSPTKTFYPHCPRCKGAGYIGGKPEETLDSYYGRLEEIIGTDLEHFFTRFNVPVSTDDIQRFKVRCLNPILEQLCDWWGYVSQDGDAINYFGGPHWQHPFGVYNTLNEGGSSDLDGYLEDGNESGLTRVDNLFPELTKK